MISRIGPTELVLILAIALIIFGPKKLPEIGKALGNAIREFKNSSSKLQKELDVSDDDQESTVQEKNAKSAEPSVKDADSNNTDQKG